jgi:ParB family chromosome partitioning protein
MTKTNRQTTAPSKAFVQAWLALDPKRSGRGLCREAGIDESTVAQGLAEDALPRDFKIETLVRLAPAMKTTVGAMLGEAPPAAAPGSQPVVSSPVPAHPAQGYVAAGGLLMLRVDQVEPDRNNPRKFFDREQLESLAGDIADKGIHTPAVVRRHPTKPDHYIIIAGERRHRAAGLVVKWGRWQPADANFPAVLKDVDALGALDIAMSENVQRASMHPLEEGAGFRRMRDEFGLRTDQIAEKYGKTQRWVQMRIELDEKLSPKAKQHFLKGEMRLSVAEELIRAPHDIQDKLIKGVDPESTADDVRDDLKRSAMPLKTAIFKPEDYKGPLLLDGDGKPIGYADGKQATGLQKAAIKAKVKELEKAGWAFIERKSIHFNPGNTWSERWEKSADKAKAGCFVCIDESDLDVKFHVGWAKAPKPGNGAGSGAARKGPAKPEDAFTKVHLDWCQQTRTLALQDAVLQAGPAKAIALATFALLSGTGGFDDNPTRLRTEHLNSQSVPDNPQLAARLAELLKPAAGKKLVGQRGGDSWDVCPGKEAELFAWLLASSATPQIFTALIAVCTGDWVGYRPSLGASDTLIDIAAALKADPRNRFKLNEAYLMRFNRAGLERIAREAVKENKARAALPQKKADAVAWILKHADAGWTPAEIAFATPKAILKALKAEPALLKAADKAEEKTSKQQVRLQKSFQREANDTAKSKDRKAA